VIHHEGVSHGKDTSQGIKAYQIRNAQIFFDRWKSVLASDHFAPGTNMPFARDRSGKKPHILIVDHQVPEPDHDAGSRAMLDYVKLFVRAGFQVTFWPHDLRHRGDYAVALQQLGVEVIYGVSGTLPTFSQWIEKNGNVLDCVLL